MTIITAAEIQKGDLIRVTRDQTCEDRKGAYVQEGVAAEFTFGKWRTAKGWQFFTDFENAVIELLDRPKPKIELPTGKHAVIQYHRGSTLWTARFDGNDWHLSGNGFDWGLTYNPRTLADMLNEHKNSNPRTDFKVLFEGVKK